MKIIEKTYEWLETPVKRSETNYIILHHAAAENCTADDIHRWHRANGWSGIGYNFFVRKDGSVYRGRPEYAVGAHTSGHNYESVGICFEGNYQTEKTMPEAQLKAGQELIAYLRGKYPKAVVMKHGDFNATDCPGKDFPFDALLEGSKGLEVKVESDSNTAGITFPTVKKGSKDAFVLIVQTRLKNKNYTLEADGIFGDVTEAKVKKHQKKRGLTADGVVGAKTWKTLLS